MRDAGKAALNDTKYIKRYQMGMFDDMDQEEGWGYLMNKIFEIPRNEKFVQMLTAR